MRTASSPDDKIEIIQVLRGIAATLVAGFHLNAAGEKTAGYEGIFNVFRHGEVGVDLFFVISGFIIFYTSARRPNLTAWTFAKARFWRIFPPYWAILALYVGLAVALGALTGDTSKVPDAGTLIISVLLVPYPDYVIPIAWTLAI
jgi:peptidoglycan/LPS O-acetylase OafA/YrhL